MRRAFLQASAYLRQAVPPADGAAGLALPPHAADPRPAFFSSSASAAAAAAAPGRPDRGRAPFLFTSECVTGGHPDKLCDQISDAVLDACLRRDPQARVAVETAVKGTEVWIFGELTLAEPPAQQQAAAAAPPPPLDFAAVARRAIAAAGYTGRGGDGGFSAESAQVRVSLDVQSADIAQGIGGARGERLADDDLGAGDQGHVFGYATDEHARTLMPMTHVLSARLAERLAAVREGRGGREAEALRGWLRPDGKTQVTLEHAREGGGAVVPLRAHTVLVSTQHGADAPLEALRAEVERHVVRPVFAGEGAARLLDPRTRVLVNPAGRFVAGGPVADAGLTGRKIIVDSYGGWGAHGGGAFSGKDASKVDRSGAYAARQAAKSVVASGLARRCLVQVAYAIGVAEPLALHVDTYGTAFDWRPAVLRRRLGLARGGDEARGGRFQRTAAFGHFGRGGGDDDDVFTWEKVVPLKLP